MGTQSRISFRSVVALCAAMLALGTFVLQSSTEAQARRGGSQARASAHGSNMNRNTNVNRNANVNVNRDVDVHVHGSYGYGYDRWGHPIAATAAVVGTALALGTIVASLPPQCFATVVGNVTYQHCGNTFYQPVYSGTAVQYVVVAPP